MGEWDLAFLGFAGGEKKEDIEACPDIVGGREQPQVPGSAQTRACHVRYSLRNSVMLRSRGLLRSRPYSAAATDPDAKRRYG